MTDIARQLFIPPTATLKEAMYRLDETEKKILFVVEEPDRMVGTITDGDIRRWILADGKLDDRVDRICNRNPVAASAPYDLHEVRRTMVERSINCIPVVAPEGCIVDILFWDRIFGEAFTNGRRTKIGLPVVIMAGGKGTRLDPFTRILPKPLIPVGDKTILEHIIESFVDYGVEEFILSVNHKSKIIKSYFEELGLACSIRYIEENMPLGTAGSLRYLGGAIDGSFIVTNCDIIVQTNYAELVAHHDSRNDDITIVASIKNYNIPYGICEIENGGTLVKMTEKPEYNFLVNTGMYVVKPAVLNLIPHDTVFHFTDLIEAVKSNGGRISVFPINEGSWLDTGEWQEYRKVLSRFTEDPV
jgi:dTDP-glucose pyrophosphorylase